MRRQGQLSAADYEQLQNNTFIGKEKKSLAYVIGIMNMILHGVEAPNITHSNTLAENIADIQQKDEWILCLLTHRLAARNGQKFNRTSQSKPVKQPTCSYNTLSKFLKLVDVAG